MRSPILVLLSLSFLACGSGKGSSAADAAPTIDAAAVDAACQGGAPKTIFLNRGGGTYTPGTDDSSTNVSSLISAQTVVAAETIDDTVWQGVITCLQDRFAPFNVVFTDVDPGAAIHREVVVSNAATQTICSTGCAGVSPLQCPATAGTDPLPAAVVVVRPPAFFGATPTTAACETYAQIIANSFGLDHSFKCEDLMTFLSGCGDKSFLDMDVPCGETAARTCNCGGDTQNSYQTLLGLAGPACQ